MNRKGIILAGGSGTRLYPITSVVSKQLIHVYDKPMIYYPLSILILSGIRDILIITTPQQQGQFKQLLGDGANIGCSISYDIQDNPKGISEAFIIGEKFIGDSPVALILGDNIFYGDEFCNGLFELSKADINYVFGYRVSNPQDYGVVEFATDLVVKNIEEKPSAPKSRYAVPGLYFYDNNVIDIAKNLKPSNRGELEITDLNNILINNNKLEVSIINDNTAWFDTGTPDSLFEATMFVKAIQSRTGKMISCIEECSYIRGFLSKDELLAIGKKYEKCYYGKYIIDKYGK